MNKETTKELGKIILLCLVAGGITLSLAVAPGLGHVLKFIRKKEFEKYKTHRINQALKRLEKQEFISIKEEDGKVSITLLDRGKQKVLSYKLEEMVLKQGEWDKTWRIVIFDIPEEKRIARDFLRDKMKELGFYALQKSVLVTPWDCRNEIDFIRHFYEVGDHVNLVEAKRFDGEEKVKSHFNI